MAFAGRSLESLTEKDLQELVNEGAVEQRSLEFKQALPGGADSDRREFVADVVSLANAEGGHIVFGMKEDRGAAVELMGLVDIDQDKERLRFEQMVRDGVDPRLTGVSSCAVKLSSGRAAVVLRVPRSWARPHMVRANSKFFGRGSNGKFQMTHADIRQAFAAADAVGDRLRRFRNDRLLALGNSETPVGQYGGPMLVLHLLPFAAAEGQVLDLSGIDRYDKRLDLLVGSHEAPRYNFDGYLVPGYARNSVAKSYVQVFRNGVLEALEGDMFDDVNKRIPTVTLAETAIHALPRFLAALKSLGVEPPVFVALSLLHVRRYRLAVGERYEFYRGESPPPLDRDAVPVPEIQLDDFAASAEGVLRPLLDVVWNAGGFARCLQYDEHGKWHRDRP